MNLLIDKQAYESKDTIIVHYTEKKFVLDLQPKRKSIYN